VNQGHNQFVLQSSNRQMSISRLGGRITAFSLNGKNALVSSGIQTGSTFWPSPQSLWNWPPPQSLDEEPYELLGQTDQTIRLQSKIDPHLGVRIEKEVSAVANGVKLKYGIANESEQIVTMAPWEISRVGGGITFYSAERPPEPQSTCPIDHVADHYWYEYEVAGLGGIPKIFANSTDGWLANVHNGLLFLKKFPRIEVADIAPGEAEVEIYAHADNLNPYIEIEQQGAFKALLPGMKMSWSVEWLLFAVPAHVDVGVGSHSLLDFVGHAFESSARVIS